MATETNQNYLWIVMHGKELDQYSGRWVAIDEGKLIAVADSLKKLEETAKVKLAKHPLFHLVPRPEEAISILTLL